jgi:hypothetical protein
VINDFPGIMPVLFWCRLQEDRHDQPVNHASQDQ